MNKTRITLYAVLSFGCILGAEAQTDSIMTHQLDEVKIEIASNYAIPEGVAYVGIFSK